MTGARRDYSSVGRRRQALGRAAAIVLVLIGVLLVWTSSRSGGEGKGTKARVERTPAPPKHWNLDWPAEGQAAVAVTGFGTLGSSGRQRPVPIASVAKVMTAYLVLREEPLGPGEEGFTMEVGSDDVEDVQRRLELNQSVIAVEVGEELSERQALEALLLPSANNVASMLAVEVAGSEADFVEDMNEAARELGMRNTRYTDPSGFEDGTVSTAADQLKLGRAAMADPTFAEIVALPAAVLPVVGEVANLNQLVGHDGFVGIKTGSKKAAGGCLLFAKRIRVGGRTRIVLGAVLGQRQGDFIPAALASADRLADSAAAAVRRRSG